MPAVDELLPNLSEAETKTESNCDINLTHIDSYLPSSCGRDRTMDSTLPSQPSCN